MTTITKINLTKENKLNFDVSVDGTVDTPIRTTFGIILPKFDMVFAGSKEGNGYEFVIPPLKEYAQEGNYDCYLTVFVGDNHYTPMRETIELTKPVVVESKLISVSVEKPTFVVKTAIIRENAIDQLKKANKCKNEIVCEDGVLTLDNNTCKKLVHLYESLKDSQKSKFIDLSNSIDTLKKLTKQ